MLEFTGLNWLAILVATVAGFALGGIWYGPLFGDTWLAALGKTATRALSGNFTMSWLKSVSQSRKRTPSGLRL